MNSQKDTIWGKDYQNSCIDEVTSILLSGHYVLIIISGMTFKINLLFYALFLHI